MPFKDNLCRAMIGVRSDKMKSERIRELDGVRKGEDESINENRMKWYGDI